MARILFVHNNFPAQFQTLARLLPEGGHECKAIASPTGRSLPSVPVSSWRIARGTTPGIFEPAVRAEADLIRGAAAAEAARALQVAGFEPDLIIAHPGWGETVFLKEVFPRARQILYGEFYYRTAGGDVGFDPEFGPPRFSEAMRVFAKNAAGALAYAEADCIVSPTAFQGSMLPVPFQGRLRVIHEGVDTDAITPGPARRLRLADGTILGGPEPVVTFVNRRFEPMRGFHTFMRALPELFARVPNARAVLIGSDQSDGYGLPAGAGTSWKARLLAELGNRLDTGRVHFTGPLPPDQMHALMRVGAAHVYLTYPFALSWSMLEAMAVASLLIGSRTPPVEEVIVHRENGLLVDMLDPADLASAMIEACTRPREHLRPLREAARRTVVERYDKRRVCDPAWLALVEEVLAGAA